MTVTSDPQEHTNNQDSSEVVATDTTTNDDSNNPDQSDQSCEPDTDSLRNYIRFGDLWIVGGYR
jgi:hypothetical protein